MIETIWKSTIEMAGHHGEQAQKDAWYLQRTKAHIERVKKYARILERRMPEHYTGIQFSNSASNPLGVKEARKAGIPGTGEPAAIMNFKQPPLDDPTKQQAMVEAAAKWGKHGMRIPGKTGYVRLNAIHYETGLGYTEIMGLLNHMRERDPYSVSFGVDRLGKPVYVTINLPKRTPIGKDVDR